MCPYCGKLFPPTRSRQTYCSPYCARRRRPLMARFFSYVKKTPACWIWIGGINKRGYGNFGIDRRTKSAHRVSWRIAHGNIKHGLNVCHHCDNKRCVRPSHLFLGTNLDNSKDLVSKQKHPHGESHPRAKLNERDILNIRNSFSGKHGQLSCLGRQYGVSANQIRLIVLRHQWKHVP